MANDVKIVLTAQDKASEGINRVAGRIKALENASSAVAARMGVIGAAMAGVVSVGAGLALSKQFVDMADAMSLLQSRVKLATSGAAEFAQVQADLFALAQRNSVSLEEVASAYSRLADPVKRLGGGSKEAVGIIDALSKSLKISGASSQEAAAAIQQFGQAMGSGKLQGDEFKSLAESAPRFMKALAEGSGIAAENLKDMASEGKLTADVVGNALLKSLGKLNDEAAQMPNTVGQAMTRLKNDIAKAVDEINQAGGINGGLAGLVGDAGQLIGPIKQELIEAFQSVALWIENNREGLAETGRAVGGVVSDMWRMAEAMASVAGFVAEAGVNSGLLKTVLEAVRIILAGIEDGITIIGAAFVKVGADVVDVLYKPLGNLMLAYGNALDMLGSSSAQWWQETGDRIRNTTNAAHEYADGVYEAFANNESALGRLNTQLANTAAAQSEAGSAAATAGVALAEQGKTAAKTAAAFASLRASLKGDADKGKSDTDKGKSGPDPYQSLLEGLRRQLATTEKLSAVEKLNVELQEKKYEKLTALQKAQLQAVATQIDAQQRLAAVRKLDDADEAARVAWTKRHGQALAEEEQAIWDKVEAQLQATRVIGLSKTATEELTLADMEQQLAWRESLGLNDDITESLKRRIAAQKQLIAETQNGEIKQAGIDAAKAAADAHKKAAEEAAREWQKTVDTIDGTFHDAFTDMLKQGEADWESFTDSLATTFKSAVADEIYKMTLKPLVLNVVGSFSGAGAPAVPGADGQPLSISNGFGVISGVQAAWAGMNGGIANAASSFATSGMGQYLGLSTVTPAGYTMGPPTAAGAYGYTAGGSTSLTGAGSSAVGAAGWVAAILAAIYTGFEWQKRGWFNDNSTKGYLEEQEDVFTKLYSKHDRLFGRNRFVSPDAGGIQGVFDTSGFTGDRWQQFSQRGGTFRSDKRWTDTFELDSDIDSYLDSLMRQTVSQLQAIGKTLDVETVRAVEGFSHQFSLQLSENGSWEKAGEKIAGEMAKVSDELVKSLVPGLADLSLFGETATQTFTRLGQEVAATDAILLAMGKNAAEAFGGVGLASIAARENLIDLAGGLDNLATKTQAYYQAYYSSNEQLQLAAKQAQAVLVTGFADIGQSIPATRAEFRALVEAQDLSSESGRKLWNSLLDLSDEFDTVQKLADSAKQSQATLFDTFATDTQKLNAAKKLVSDTFGSINKTVPDSADAFLTLAQSIDPATEAGQSLITALGKVSNAFAYVQTSAVAAAAAVTQANSARRSVVDTYDPTGAVARAQADIAAAFAKYGATAPKDQEGVAAIANSLDTSTDLGRQQLYELQALSGAFDKVFAANAASAAARGQSISSQRSVQDSFDPAGAVARAQADIAAAFGKYGATVPTTRAGVVDVAASINTGTALGQQQMSELRALSSAFDTVFSAQERAAQAAADAAKALADEQARAAQEAMEAAQRAAAEQMRAAQAAAEEQMRLATQVHDSISSALKSLLGQSEVLETQSRQQAQATLQSALAIAKAGGSLNNFAGLDSALQAVSKIEKSTFSTALDYARDFGKSANVLTQLEKYTRVNGSHADGLDYVPFDGYVAQLHRGERVQTAASAAAADATASEIKALRADLNAIGAALATNTQKTAKLMEKFDVIGLAARA